MPEERTGEKAYPFNFFYWDFLSRHRNKLKAQGCIGVILANLERISSEGFKRIHQESVDWYARNALNQ